MADRRGKPAWQSKIAKERVAILFREAVALFSEKNEQISDSEKHKLANRYVFIARKIAMKFNLKLPSELRRQFCHKCYHFLVPGRNARVRTNAETQCVEWKCLDCGNVNRFGYSREKK